MNKLLFLLVIGIFTACGGGGDDEISCPDDAPLACQESQGCCPRGFSFACDGLCFRTRVTGCGQSEICTFNGKSTFIEDDSVDSSNLISEPMYYTPIE